MHALFPLKYQRGITITNAFQKIWEESNRRVATSQNKKIMFRAIFFGNNKYYPQVFLDECLYKIKAKSIIKSIKS